MSAPSAAPEVTADLATAVLRSVITPRRKRPPSPDVELRSRLVELAGLVPIASGPDAISDLGGAGR